MILQFFIHIQNCSNGCIEAGEKFVFYNQKVNIALRINELTCYRIFVGVIVVFEKRIDFFLEEVCNDLQGLRCIVFVIAFLCGIRRNYNRRNYSTEIPEFIKQLHGLGSGRAGQHCLKALRLNIVDEVLMQIESNHI